MYDVVLHVIGVVLYTEAEELQYEGHELRCLIVLSQHTVTSSVGEHGCCGGRVVGIQ